MASLGTPVFLIHFAIMTLSQTVVADSGGDFSNNLFSDLGPILALFGEQVAKQFMSQSMGWADNVIFAMAPLGIITAIVGAIRVGGPGWLKAIIGRARENKAAAEVELMSSTSQDVCELWNGQAIVRVMGKPPILELVYIPELAEEGGPRLGLFTLDRADEGGFKPDRKKPSFIEKLEHHIRPKNKDTESNDTTKSDKNRNFSGVRGQLTESQGSSPNIYHNLTPPAKRTELHVIAFIGIVLQLAVLAFSGLAAYYTQWGLRRGSRATIGYAYPFMAVGTMLLVTGMLICSFVIEQSTKENTWRIGKSARIMWLQKGQEVNDQLFDSYAIFAKGARESILTSRPITDSSPRTDIDPDSVGLLVKFFSVLYQLWSIPKKKSDPHLFSVIFEALAIAGTTASVGGFIVQLIGLRGMHWSATIAQLGATMIMVILRAFVRRGLADRPSDQKTLQGHELDWLATRIARDHERLWPDPDIKDPEDEIWSENCWRWSIVSGGGFNNYSFNGTKDTDANKVMKIRRRLGSLSSWSGIASGPAISVAIAIEAVMNTLFTSGKHHEKLLTWSMDARFGNPQSIYFDIKQDKNGKWKADATEIEAALSLWLYSTWQEESPEVKRAQGDELRDWLRDGSLALKKESIRLLGPNREGTRRDLRWYTVGQLDMILEVQELSNAESGGHDVAADILSVDKHRVVGFQDREAPKSWNSRLVKFERRVLPEVDPVWDGNRNSFNSAPVWSNAMLAVAPDTQLVQLLAQDMFSTFMWAVAQKTDRIDGETSIRADGVQNLSNAAGWQHFRLENSKLTAMAEGFQRSGLGSLEEAYLGIIPQLSTLQKLPVALPLIKYACNIAQHSEAVGHWKEASEVFLRLFQVGQTFDKFDPVAIKTTAVLYEFHRTVDSMRELWNSQLRDPGSIREMDDIKSKLLNQLETEKAKPIVETLDSMCVIQNRKWNRNESSEALGITAKTVRTKLASSGLSNLTELHLVVIEDSLKFAELLEGTQYRDPRDLLEWTPLHYSVAVGQGQIVKNLLTPKSGRRADPNPKDLNALTPLHYAACNGRDSIVLTLLDEGGELEAQGRDGMRPLHYAVKEGHESTTKLLLEAGADLEAHDSSRRTPFHWASYAGHKSIVLFLKNNGAKLTSRDDYGRIPLHMAVVAGREACVEYLVDKGIMETKDRLGMTPLLLGARVGMKGIAELLLEKGADVEAKAGSGRTPLSWAAEKGHEAMARLLLEKGADMESRDWFSSRTPLSWAAEEGHEAVVRLLLEKGADVESKAGSGRTPLSWAAEKGHEAMVKLLLEKGADVESQDGDGWTPISWAAGNGHEAVVKLLLEKGAYVESGDNSYDRTPLSWAAENGHKAVVKLLLEKGADVESGGDSCDRTPLSWAAGNGHEAVVRLLLEGGAYVESEDDSYGQTPLSWAAENGHKTVVRLLLEKGADLESKNRDDRTPLSWAAGNGHEAVIKLLLEKGADVKFKDGSGRTPLSWAAERGHRAVIKLLLEKGADIESKDGAGRTPLSWAVGSGHEAVVKLLESATCTR